MRSTLISYPKSGRTWLRYIVHLSGCEIEFSHAGTATSPRHLGRRRVPVHVERVRDRSVTFLHRNPIDTTVSLYFQIFKKDLAVTESLPLRHWWYRLVGRIPPRDIREFAFHPGFGVEKTCRFNREWLDRIVEHPRHLVISYEDMRTKPAETLERFFAHLGHVPKRPIAELVEQSSFDRMKEVEKAGNSAADLRLGIADPNDPDSAKVRSGQVRGYRKHLDDETVESLRKICARYGFDA